MIANKNVRDRVLESFKANQIEVTVFFLNGFQVESVAEEYDKYIVSLSSQGKQHLIYKHAVNTYTVRTEGQASTEGEE